MNEEVFFRIHFIDPLVDVVQRSVPGIVYVFSHVFGFPAHIHHLGVAVFHPAGKFFHRDAVNGIHFLTFHDPGVDTTFQVSDQVIKSYTAQTGHGLFHLAFFGHQQDGLFHICYQCTYPGRKVAVQADVHRLRNECLPVNGRVAGIQNESTGLFCSCFKSSYSQFLHALVAHLIKAGIAVAVHGHVHREIGRRGQESVGHFFHEFCFGHIGTQGVVADLLIADGGHGLIAHVLATGGTCTVSGIDHHVFRQGHDLFAQRMEEGSGQFFLGHAGGFLCQIRSTYISDKEGIAGEDGMLFPFLIH